MATDKKISELPALAGIGMDDISVLVQNSVDHKFSIGLLVQYLGTSLNLGASVSFGAALPQNNTGKNGDVFINTVTGQFAQRAADAWAVVYTLPAANAADGKVLYGNGLPPASAGKNSDTYINTLTGIFYLRSVNGWDQVFSMQTGPPGPPGGKGDTGAAGLNANGVLSGAINPSNTLGTNGDFYINYSTFNIFGPKTNGLWGSAAALAGAPGEKGDNGAPGTPANVTALAKLSGGNTYNGEQYFNDYLRGDNFVINPDNGSADFTHVSITDIEGIDFFAGETAHRRLFFDPAHGFGGDLWLADDNQTNARRILTTNDAAGGGLSENQVNGLIAAALSAEQNYFDGTYFEGMNYPAPDLAAGEPAIGTAANPITLAAAFRARLSALEAAVAGGGSLPTPAAPTSFVVDDANDTAAFTPAAGYAANLHRYSLNSGATWANCTSNVFAVGDFAKSVGQVQVQVAPQSGVNNAGLILSNPAAYTASNPQGLFSQVDTEWETTEGVTRTGNNLTYTQNVRAISSLKLPAGTAGTVRFNSSDALLILSSNHTNYDGFNDTQYGAGRNPVNGKVQAFSHTANELNVETGSLAASTLIAIQLTTTGGAGGIGEVIWTHDGTEWARDVRIPGELTIKSFGYEDGTLTNVEQNGFN